MADEVDDVKDAVDEKSQEFSKVAPPPPETVDEVVVIEPDDAPKSVHHNVFADQEAEAELLDFDEIVLEVLDGQWGEGKARASKLRAAGYPYLRIEAEVRRQLRD